MVLDSGRPGPRVLVVGGIHGNEPSGALAAAVLAQGRRPVRGRLTVLAEANPEALQAGERSAHRPGAQDLNRVFPGGAAGPDARRAAEVFALARDADLVLDLHEEGPLWPEPDLATLVVSPPAAGFAMDLLEALEGRGGRFAFTGGAPDGSLVGELGKRGRRALTVEVPARLPRAERIRLHLLVVEVALGQMGMRR
ncbi:MAG: succinylglutamate desuccinylase/aspartoacylase family protein [Holophaga sp.]|nr:succinylglutamate desuccinylase/aspartoacylase family protein [Holophaga sp.]